jgi:hypothetical protein
MEQNSLLLRHKELKLLERLWRRSAAAFNQKSRRLSLQSKASNGRV